METGTSVFNGGPYGASTSSQTPIGRDAPLLYRHAPLAHHEHALRFLEFVAYVRL